MIFPSEKTVTKDDSSIIWIVESGNKGPFSQGEDVDRVIDMRFPMLRNQSMEPWEHGTESLEPTENCIFKESICPLINI